MRDVFSAVAEYIEAGLALCATTPEDHKRAYGIGWQQEGREAEHWQRNPSDGVGLIHGLSGTCSIDIDDEALARIALEAVGIDLDALLNDPASLQIDSGKPNSGKLIYRLPDDIKASRHALNWPVQGGPQERQCIVELRAGAVHDVLPPSVHPDLGTLYQWRGDWRSIPELPESLARLWREWPLAREAMQEACPWGEPSPQRVPSGVKARTYSAPSGGRDIIGAFNRSYQIGELLESFGYRRAGKRWLCPNSSTGIPGVILLPDSEPERIYSHHASDRLSDGYSHDAFSVYCQLEHNGNVTAAVAAAGNLLGIVQQPDPAMQEVARNIIKNARSSSASGSASNVTQLADYIKERPEPEPEQVIAPHPGPLPCPMLRAVQAWLEAHMHAVKPDALMQGVLSFACAMTARRYTTYDGQPATTFFCTTDNSVAGLRRIKGKLSALTNDMGERETLRDRAPSGAGPFYQALMRSPRMYWITDEYGYLVRTAKRQTSGAMESTLSVLQLCYDGETIFVDPEIVATRGGKIRDFNECNIYAPAVTMFALLPNDHLVSLVSHAEYGRGTLHQMLTIPAGDALEGHSPDISKPLPSGLVEHIKRLADLPGVPGTQSNANMPPQTKSVHWAHGVGALVSSRARDWREYMADDSRQQYRGFIHGYIQSAARLATSLAAWVSPDQPTVTIEVMRWALTWAERCLKLTMPRLEISSRDDDKPDVMQLVMETLLEASEELSARDIGRRCYAFRKLGDDERDKILNNLVESGSALAMRTSQTVKYLPARK